MLTQVTNTSTGESICYTLPPKEALVAAFEQEAKRNFATWTYKDPEAYPIQKTIGGLCLGTLLVTTEVASCTVS